MFDTSDVDRAEEVDHAKAGPSTTTHPYGAILPGLRSVVEGLRSEALPELPDARLEEDFAELHRLGESLEAERLRRLAEIDRRRLFQRDGFLSAVAWLVSRCRVAGGPGT